jgi:RNA polymerase sigma factor (sigma-70 family)
VSDRERDERDLRLEMLFRQHSRAVRAYALRRTDGASAEEAVSEVFVAAWRRLEDVPADALPWLLACARRVLANQRRAGRRRVALAERLRGDASRAVDRAGGDGIANGAADHGALSRALGELGDDDRELLLLIAWEELEPERAAQALGCSKRTLAVRLHRARRRLRAALERAERADVSPTPTMEHVQ